MNYKLPYYYISFVSVVLIGWNIYMYQNDLYSILTENISVIITMIFGAFIAGSSPEGSAAIAYPVFTLLLDIDPGTTRNFAFAIQSFGMTSASIFILNSKIKIDRNYIFYVSFSGIFGLLFGTYFIVDHITPKVAKLFFVSLWLAFGLVLSFVNNKKSRHVADKLPELSILDVIMLLFFGFVGGIISSIFGTGINIFSFCFVVIYYHLNEKIATPSSVIIMSIETLVGFFLHRFLIQDFNNTSREMWLSCIPFVIFLAPLGAFVISKISRKLVATLLYLILVIQFIGAMMVLKPSGMLLVMSVSTIVIGVTLFYLLFSVSRIRQ